MRGERGRPGRLAVAAHVELEDAGNHDDGLRAIPILEQCKSKSGGAIDEQPATEAALILNNPVTLAVLADPEERRVRMRRGRFNLSHDTFLSRENVAEWIDDSGATTPRWVGQWTRGSQIMMSMAASAAMMAARIVSVSTNLPASLMAGPTNRARRA